ncbi:MAG: 30S ribosomal protein S10 [Halobacteriaceae archaeon]
MANKANITLKSGDKQTLERVVTNLKDQAQRKGIEVKGPHTDPPVEYQLPLFECLDASAAKYFDQWTYTVYSRRLQISGHNENLRDLLDQQFPESIKVELELDQPSMV